MIYKVKNGNQQQIKQPITTANERVTRASAVISLRLNCCWSPCGISSFVNELWEKLSDRRFLRNNFEYEQQINDRLRSDVLTLFRFLDLKQHWINEQFLDGSRKHVEESLNFSISSKNKKIII